MRIYCNKALKAFCLLIVILLLVQTTLAIVLESDHYDGYVKYEKDWGDGTLSGYIEFAVYDERADFESNTGLTAPGEGDYVYAYRIWNNQPFSDEAVAYFSILGLDEGSVSGFGSLDDPDTKVDVSPENAYFENGDGIWEWGVNGGFVQLDDLSWLLVYSSDYDWVAGEYDIRGTEESDFPQSGDDDENVPEPSIVALLSLGGAALIRRRKK
jgi:hypothetical protein